MIKKSLYILVVCLTGCTTAIIDEINTDELPPIEGEVLYNPDVTNIMFNSCITCHSGPAASASTDLSNYQNVRFYTESGNLINRINDQTNPMPPSGLLPARQRQIIAKWVTDGFPEN